jgi:hypothetical protein
MTEVSKPFMILRDGYKSKYFPENDTYEVTDYAYGHYKSILDIMMKEMNFTIIMYKRKDSIWGKSITNPDGTKFIY